MTRRLSIAIVSVLALLSGVGAGGAYAYWTTSGAGNGPGTVGTPANVTVGAATATPASDLLPGGTADLVVQLSNPNAYAVTIIGISQTAAVTAVGGSCTGATSGVSVTTRTGLSVAVGPGVQTIHIAAAAAMTTSSASACQDASFQIPVSITVSR